MQKKDARQCLETKDDSLYREESIGIEETAIEELEAPSSNSRIAKNALMLYIRMFLTMIVGLYTSRVVLNTLGVEDYGIYGVVGGVVAMLGFLNASMSGATSRFLTFELGRGDKKRLAETFSSALIVHVIIALIVLVLAETVGLWFLTHKLVIPAGRMNAAHWVYQMSILSAMLGITQVPYNATIIAHEKMDIYAYVEILNVTLKLLIVYLLTIGNFDKLILYALLVFAVSVIIIMLYRIYCIRHFPESHFRFLWIPSILKPLLSFSWQTIISNFSFSFRDQGISFVLNMVFGVLVNAACALASVISGVVSQFSFSILMAFNPKIIKLYAMNKIDEFCDFVILASKCNTIMMLIIAIPFVLNADFVLTSWLSQVPDGAVEFSRLLMLSVLMTCITNPLYTGLMANGNIKMISLFQSFFYILSPFVGYILCVKYRHPEIVYVIIIIFQLVTGSLILIFLKHYVASFKVIKYLKSIFLNVFIPATISSATCYFFLLVCKPSFIRVSIHLMANVVILLSLTYIGLAQHEKHEIKGFYHAIIRRTVT